jgi:hypothetical protein
MVRRRYSDRRNAYSHVIFLLLCIFSSLEPTLCVAGLFRVAVVLGDDAPFQRRHAPALCVVGICRVSPLRLLHRRRRWLATRYTCSWVRCDPSLRWSTFSNWPQQRTSPDSPDSFMQVRIPEFFMVRSLLTQLSLWLLTNRSFQLYTRGSSDCGRSETT